MKFSAVLLTAFIAPVLARPFQRDVDSALVPEFGVQAGVDPNGSGSCDGINGISGQPILIPCVCPPDRDTFISQLNANVAAGFVLKNPSVKVSFPTDNSTASQLARLETATVTLQNLNGSGVGCPQSATTWGALQKQIEAEGSSPATPTPVSVNASSSASSATGAAPTSSASTGVSGNATTEAGDCSPPSSPSPTPVSVSASSSASSATGTTPTPSANAGVSGNATTSSNTTEVDAALVPEFGVTAGQNPSGTGNCDGINGANGQPVLIPCSCPPDRDSFIEELSSNVAAGFVLNNPTVKLSFPTDNSTSSQLARLNAAAVTLQNLKGAGVGCPVSSTTFSAQQKAIEAEAS